MDSAMSTSEMTTTDLPYDSSVGESGFTGGERDEPACTTIQAVSIEEICMESILQLRVKTADMRVKSYAALMKNGIEFPPVVIFSDGRAHWLGDGKHRTLAAKQNGESTIRAEVRQGSERDAFLYGLQVNMAHGLALTNAEKRAAVDLMLQDPEWQKWSDREIARQCGVTHPFVSKCRRGMTGNGYQSSKIRKVIRGNETIELDTTNIGTGSSPTDPSAVMLDTSSTGENDQTAEPSASDEMEASLEPGHLASFASYLQSKCHDDRGIEAIQQDDGESFVEDQEASAHNNVEPQSEKSDGGAQLQPQETPSNELPWLQAVQAPVPALQGLLDRFKGNVRDFRVQHTCDAPVVEQVLWSLESELQRDQHILQAHAQCLEHVDDDMDIDETTALEPDEPREHNNSDSQGALFSSEPSPTTIAPLEPAAVVMAFVKGRSIPSCDPVAQHEVMASLHTWTGDQGLPRPTENEVTHALHQMGFRDLRVTTYNGAKTDIDWQWQGFQLLPFDAPDNEVDPFSSPNA